MPKIYRSQQRIPKLQGKVKGGIAVVIESPSEIAGLRRLVRSVADLPGDAIGNAYTVISTAGSQLSDWPYWRDRSISEEGTEPGVPHPKQVPTDDPANQLDAALGFAAMVWKGQDNDLDQIALAMVLPKPGKRLVIETKRPILLLDGGSVRARVASAGARIRQFGVALFPKAPSRRRGNLVEALRDRGPPGKRLPRLEGLQQADLTGRRGVIVFLHGLMSSDAGTFDELVARINEDHLLPHIHLVGWPHDTLSPIKVNAQDLAELIENRLGPSGLPILFVCHSRGGLVARATAVKLIRSNSGWAQRLKGAVTFGTPHMGAELAERADEFLGKLLLLKTIQRTGRAVPLVDALLAVLKAGKVNGIRDLRPTGNGGKFLYWLRDAEAKQSRAAGQRVLPMFVVGGRSEANSIAGWLSRGFLSEPSDRVVALSSTMPSNMQPSSETATDHFGYFSSEEMKKHPALGFIVGAFEEPVQDDGRQASPSKRGARVIRLRGASPANARQRAGAVPLSK